MSETPRVRVAALMIMEGKVVLVRHRAHGVAYHLLPGGGVDYRETCESALIREVAEETGLSARIGRPLFISDTIDPNGHRHVINLTFLAEVIGGNVAAHPSDRRVEAVDLICPESLPSLDLRPPIAPFVLEAIEAGLDSAPARYLGSLFTDGHSKGVT